MIRLVNGPLARALHQQLYDRMLKFCVQYTPELIAAPVVQSWLTRFYADDPSIHILYRLNDSAQLIAHALIEVQVAFGQHIVICHQQHHDKPNLAHLEEGMEYLDKLAQHLGALGTMVYVEKHSKALQKYGYKTTRLCMLKCAANDDIPETAP